MSSNVEGVSGFRLGRVFWAMVGFLVLLWGVYFVWSYVRWKEVRVMNRGDVSFEIKAGSRSSEVVDDLVSAGVIESSLFMRLYLIENGLDTRFQAGHYVILEGMRHGELCEMLTKTGEYAERVLYFLPGMNLYSLGLRLESEKVVDSESFLSLALDSGFSRSLGIPADSVEGYLLPGTYRFVRGVSASEVIERMHVAFEESMGKVRSRYGEVMKGYLEEYGLDEHGILTLASLVEKEAVLDVERAFIARVFLNRLKKGMRLQSDPSCVYPPKFEGERPSPSRCKEEGHRYSTYKIKGLPPGPISNSRIRSIEAVLEPYSGEDAFEIYYFVARQDGSRGHFFTKSYEDHKLAVRYFLKGEKGLQLRGFSVF